MSHRPAKLLFFWILTAPGCLSSPFNNYSQTHNHPETLVVASDPTIPGSFELLFFDIGGTQKKVTFVNSRFLCISRLSPPPSKSNGKPAIVFEDWVSLVAFLDANFGSFQVSWFWPHFRHLDFRSWAWVSNSVLWFLH